MSISGPSLVILKEGKPFNRYEIVVTDKTLRGYKNTKYFLKTKAEAEDYLRHLLDIEGEKLIDEALSSKKVFMWEKPMYEELRDQEDWEERAERCSHYDIIIENTFVPIK